MSSPQPVSKIVCSFCSKAFLRTEHLTRHLRTHTNERPYLCDICEKGFSRSDILARHRNAHQQDDAHKSSIQSSKAVFRACFQCATARVKCSGSLPCRRCVIKERDCQYPVVQNRKKPKSKKRTSSRELLFQTDTIHHVAGVETVSNINNAIHPNLSSWMTDSSTKSNLVDNNEFRFQNSQFQDIFEPSENQLIIDTSFNNFNTVPETTHLPNSGQFQAWIGNSIQQSSPNAYSQDLDGFTAELVDTFHLSTPHPIIDNEWDRSLTCLSLLENQNPRFSFEEHQCDYSGSDNITKSQISTVFGQEAILSPDNKSISQQQQHPMYQCYRNDYAAGNSSPISLQSSNILASSPGVHHSPATSISPSLVSVCESQSSEQIISQYQAKSETHLRVQIPHYVHSSSSSLLPSPAPSVNHSRYLSEGNHFSQTPQFANHHHHHLTQQPERSSSSHKYTISSPFPSPRPSPDPRNKQHYVPIGIEKQVLEYPPTCTRLVSASVYTTLMIKFKNHCLKQSLPFMSDYFPSVVVLELSVSMYNEHFAPVFPLLVKKDLGSEGEGKMTDDEKALLLLAVCAIGIAYMATDEAWLCSEAFLEFLRRMLEQVDAPLPLQGHPNKSKAPFTKTRLVHIQARILQTVALFRSPNRILAAQALEGKKMLVEMLKDGVLDEQIDGWNGDHLIEAKKRAACCIWWLDTMMVQKQGHTSAST